MLEIFDMSARQFWLILAIVTAVGGILILFTHASRYYLGRSDLAALRVRLSDETAKLREAVAAFDTLNGEIAAAQAALSSAEATKRAVSLQVPRNAGRPVRYIHEIGRSQGGNTVHYFPLRVVGDWKTQPPSRTIFHPSIWTQRNIAQVWATDQVAAAALAGAVFTADTGLEVGPPMDGPDARVAATLRAPATGRVPRGTPADEPDEPMAASA